MSQILLIGIEHHNVYGVLKSFYLKGLVEQVYLILIGDNSHYLYLSKYILKERIFCVASESHLVRIMNEMKFLDKVVVVCCSDASISYLDRHREELDSRYILPKASRDIGGISHLMSKSIQSSLAQEVGLLCPNSKTFIKGIQDLSEFIEDIHFPCIIKPIDSVIAGKSEIHICNNSKSLSDALMSSQCTSFIIQEYIDKCMEFQIIGCALDEGREIIAPGYSRIIRQPGNTNTGFLEYIPIDDKINKETLEGVKNLISSIGYEGLFSVEFVQDRQGTNYFLEINMRNDGNAICVTDAGCNLPYIWYLYADGEDWRHEAEDTVERLYCMPIISDLTMLLKGKISLWSWIQDIKMTNSFMDYSNADWKPFLKELYLFVISLFRRIIGIK